MSLPAPRNVSTDSLETTSFTLRRSYKSLYLYFALFHYFTTASFGHSCTPPSSRRPPSSFRPPSPESSLPIASLKIAREISNI